MTSTNRFANRLLIVVVGIVLLCAGLAAAAVVLNPTATTIWNQNAPRIRAAAESLLLTPTVPGTSTGWVLLGTLAALVILIALLVAFIWRQGGGRTGRLLVRRTGETGTTIIDSDVATGLLQDALTDDPEILAAHVTAYAIKGTTALKIAVTCRRGASPQRIGRTIDRLLTALDDVLGVDIPAYVQISGGFRARLTARTRLDQRTSPTNIIAPANP